MNKTDIEYLDFTWNPTAMRCTRVSKGCANCWHLRMCDRLAANPRLSPEIRAAYAGTGPPVLIEERLQKPFSRRKPAVIGVQFMGDLFHRRIALSSVRRVWDTMAACPEHTFVILTKRPRSMSDTVAQLAPRFSKSPTVWLGVSIEDQETADERIPFLLRTWATKWIVSVEPMLGSVIFRRPDFSDQGHGAGWLTAGNAAGGPSIDWVIAGCESGPGRRPAPQGGFISLRDQCVEAGIPFFLKQMEIDGKVVKMPELEGQVWDLFPGEPVAER